MSLVNFTLGAGVELFSKPGSDADSTEFRPSAADTAPAKLAAAIQEYVESQGLKADELSVIYDGTTQTVTVSGTAADQATKEKIVLACGNVTVVAGVYDLLAVADSSGRTASDQQLQVGRHYTVRPGDTLPSIAKDFYNDANAYQIIFDANRPMLESPDKIYPGQVLLIPAQS